MEIRNLSSTSNILRISISKNDGTGDGKTGLTNASSGLIISSIADNEAVPVTYTVAGSTIETISSLGTYTAPSATKCRFKEVDSTNLPGIYELHLADARFAVASSKNLVVVLSGVSGMERTVVQIPLPLTAMYSSVGVRVTSVAANAIDAASLASDAQSAIAGATAENFAARLLD